MLKIIDKYLIKEISSAGIGVVAVLLVILLGNTTLGVLRKVAEGTLHSSVLFPLLGINLVHYLVVLLPLGLYLGILFAMGRLYKDSEMSALSAGGVSVMQLYRPVIWVSIPVVLLTSYLAFFAVPWTSGTRDTLRSISDNQSEIAGVVPGRFNKLNGDQSTLFLESFSADKTRMLNVFVHNTNHEGMTTIETATEAQQSRLSDDGSAYMIFKKGIIYSGEAGKGDYRITEYETHGMRVRQRRADVINLRISAVSTSDLLKDDSVRSKAEMQWRMRVPMLTLILALLALPLSYSSPRKGRYSKLTIGILSYIIYNNMLSMARASLEKGSIPDWIGLWWVHALLILFITVLLCKQMGVRFFPKLTQPKNA